ncbi:IS630 family transposase [Caldichromatium japonicum]|uniref:IS630 family transposase n=1 Tax=Caldichromatium japonicum TaxID=2699430 RepID=UPI001FEB5CF1|nr:IS630 family transposase [Caldichromatium japonicum]
MQRLWARRGPRAQGKVGEKRALLAEQDAQIRKLMCDGTPDELKLPFALWSRQAVRQLILGCFGIELRPQGEGKYMARWGLTPQKPIRRAYEQSPPAGKTWLEETYPDIARRAKAEGAEIHWGDETGLRSDEVRGRSYAPAIKTPEIRVTHRREGLSVISTLTNRGKVPWKAFAGAMNADILIDFMKRLVKDARGKKIFLILDNLRVHHTKPVKAWLAACANQIEASSLPPYSPALNPNEMLKATITAQAPSRTKDDLKKATVSHLRRLLNSPQRIMRYFQHPKLHDAA